MKVKLLVSMAGADFAHSPGEIVDLKTAWAERLIASGQAEKIETKKKEKATARSRETAAK